MRRPRVGVMALAALTVGGAVALIHRSSRVATGRAVDGGVLIGDAGGYDRVSRLLFGPLFKGIAADVATIAPMGGKTLEVGCGPGLLSVRLARSHGLEVTGLDLDPAMIDRARANAMRSSGGGGPRPSFVIGDVAALPFPDSSFDLVVSTFSMHHWADRTAGLSEIARVLHPGGVALIWDLKPGIVPFHPEMHHPTVEVASLPLRVASLADWRWPGPLTLAQRIVLDRE